MADVYSILSDQLSELDPTIIEPEVERAAQIVIPWSQIIRWKDFTGPGRTRSITQAPNLTMSATTNSGLGNSTDGFLYGSGATAFNTTARSVTDAVYGVDVLIGIDAEVASITDVEELIEDSMSKAYEARISTSIMATYTESNTDLGSAATPISYDLSFLAGLRLLATNAAPRPYHWVMASPQLDELYVIPQFSNAQQYGQAVLSQDGTNFPEGWTGLAPLGVKIWFSNNYTASSGNHGMMFAQRAIEYNQKMPFKIGIDATRLFVGNRSAEIGGTAYYGVTGTRDTSTTNAWIVDIVS